MTRVVLFSDVDGSLLDGAGRYAMGPLALQPYLPALQIVLASSRTVGELIPVQRDLGITGPVVAENGAVVACPAASADNLIGEDAMYDGEAWIVVRLGVRADTLRQQLLEGVQRTGVPIVDQETVAPGLDRRCSVLFRPAPGSAAESLAPLVADLRAQGLTVASGGSWQALTGNADKGTGAAALLQHFGGDPRPTVAAVGDEDNDVPLLRAAGRGFVIRRPDGTWHPELAALPGVTRLGARGIWGWRTVVRVLGREATTPR
jgi:mannosyl-3-phosphoglycerate phosphatase